MDNMIIEIIKTGRRIVEKKDYSPGDFYNIKRSLGRSSQDYIFYEFVEDDKDFYLYKTLLQCIIQYHNSSNFISGKVSVGAALSKIYNTDNNKLHRFCGIIPEKINERMLQFIKICRNKSIEPNWISVGRTIRYWPSHNIKKEIAKDFFKIK